MSVTGFDSTAGLRTLNGDYEIAMEKAGGREVYILMSGLSLFNGGGDDCHTDSTCKCIWWAKRLLVWLIGNCLDYESEDTGADSFNPAGDAYLELVADEQWPCPTHPNSPTEPRQQQWCKGPIENICKTISGAIAIDAGNILSNLYYTVRGKLGLVQTFPSRPRVYHVLT